MVSIVIYVYFYMVTKNDVIGNLFLLLGGGG